MAGVKARLRRGYARLLEACGLVAGVLIGVLALLISVDVVIRNLGLGNFPWALEVGEYAIYLSAFLAAPWVLRQGAHVRVDLLLGLVPPRVGRALEFGTDLLGALICLTIVWYGAVASAESFLLDARIVKELVVSEWWLLAVLPISCGMMAAEFAARALRAFAGEPGSGAAAPTDGF